MYAAYNPGGAIWPKTKIGLWTSDDGQTWTYDSDVLTLGPGTYDDTGIYAPRLLIEDATHWYMWYSCEGSTQAEYWIALAHSSDGKSWTKDGLCTATGFTSGGATSNGCRFCGGWVVKEGSTYYMVSHGEAPHSSFTDQYGTQLFVHKSTDKVNWTTYSGRAASSNPFVPKTKSWEIGYSIIPINSDESQISDPCIFLLSNNLYVYYDGMYQQSPNVTHPHHIGLVKIPYGASVTEIFEDGSKVDDSTSNQVDLLYGQYKAGLPGKAGNGFYFPGVHSSYRSTANTTILNALGAFTVEFWLNLAAYPPTYAAVLSKADIGGGTPGNFVFYIRLGPSSYMQFGVPTSAIFETNDTAAPSLSTWYHFVGVYDGANITLYKNGAQVGTPTPRTGSTNSLTKPIYVGAGVAAT